MTRRTFRLTREAAEHAIRDVAYCTRLRIVRLHGLGYVTTQIGEMIGVPRSSLMRWCRTYRTEGVTALDDRHVGGNRAKLTRNQVADLSRMLHRYTSRSLLGLAATTADSQARSVANLQHTVTSGRPANRGLGAARAELYHALRSGADLYRRLGMLNLKTGTAMVTCAETMHAAATSIHLRRAVVSWTGHPDVNSDA